MLKNHGYFYKRSRSYALKKKGKFSQLIFEMEWIVHEILVIRLRPRVRKGWSFILKR